MSGPTRTGDIWLDFIVPFIAGKDPDEFFEDAPGVVDGREEVERAFGEMLHYESHGGWGE